jgi:hypothetical protein
MMSSIYYCTLYQKTSLNRTRPPHHHLCAFLFIVILRKSCMFLFSVHFVCPLNFIIYITAAATTTIQQQHIIIERERERDYAFIVTQLLIYICSKLDMRLVVGGALLSVPNIVVAMEWREEGTLLTGLQLWPSYNSHDLGSFLGGHISLKNRTYRPLLIERACPFKNMCLHT